MRSCYRRRAFLKGALVSAAGSAGEQKFRSQAGGQHAVIGISDGDVLNWYGRVLWTMCGRDGRAFQRLVWREACRLMDDPEVWRAVEAVEGELFSGLLRQEPMDPRPGDQVQFVMPGERAEELIAAAGIEAADIRVPHQCDSGCIRPSRRISRRWQEYLDAWAAEGPKNAA